MDSVLPTPGGAWTVEEVADVVPVIPARNGQVQPEQDPSLPKHIAQESVVPPQPPQTRNSSVQDARETQDSEALIIEIRSVIETSLQNLAVRIRNDMRTELRMLRSSDLPAEGRHGHQTPPCNKPSDQQSQISQGKICMRHSSSDPSLPGTVDNSTDTPAKPVSTSSQLSVMPNFVRGRFGGAGPSPWSPTASTSTHGSALNSNPGKPQFRREPSEISQLSVPSLRSDRTGRRSINDDAWQCFTRTNLVTKTTAMYPLMKETESGRGTFYGHDDPSSTWSGNVDDWRKDNCQDGRADHAARSSSSLTEDSEDVDDKEDESSQDSGSKEKRKSTFTIGLRAQQTFLNPMQVGSAKRMKSTSTTRSLTIHHRSTTLFVHKKAARCWSYLRQKCLQTRRGMSMIVNHYYFDYTVGVLLMLNAVSNGAQVDHMARSGEDAIPRYFRIFEITFCALFSVELAMRIFVHGSRFFFGNDWKWNVFDTIVVAMQLMDELMSSIMDLMFGDLYNTEQNNFSFFRVLRLLRIVRILRFVRILRLVRELHVMVCSVAGSLRNFLWTCAIFLGMVYIFAVWLTQLVVDHVRVHPDAFVKDPALRLYYGSLGSSVLSLFQATSGGVDWADMVTPLTEAIDPVMAVVFAFYIAFATLVMLNLVTGIFVDSASNNIREDRDLDLVNRVRELFVSSDENSSGSITHEEFLRQLGNPQMEAYFKVVDLDICEADGLFRLLDIHGAGEISYADFVNGCLGLRGPAKAIDLKTLMFNLQRVFRLLRSNGERVEDLVTELIDQFHSLSDSIRIIENKVEPQLSKRRMSSMRRDKSSSSICSRSDTRSFTEPHSGAAIQEEGTDKKNSPERHSCQRPSFLERYTDEEKITVTTREV